MNRDSGLNRIDAALEKHWQTGTREFTREKLSGDAGHRTYYRSRHANESIVVMDTKHPLDPGTDPFITIDRYLASRDLPVPDILDVHPDTGILLLQDLGDTTLQHLFHSHQETVLNSEYDQVLDLLVRMHTRCDIADSSMPAPVRNARFDYDKLRWELDFFHTHFIAGYRNIRLDTAEARILTRTFDALCRRLDEEKPLVFTHRDFHSRNLMVTGGKVVMIDFQDARLGLPEYDLASLLRDAYVELPEPFIDQFLAEYYSATHDPRDAHRQRTVFALMCIQRNLKALGTFGYQTMAMNNPHYIRYVPILGRHILRELDFLESGTGTDLPDPRGFRSIVHGILD